MVHPGLAGDAILCVMSLSGLAACCFFSPHSSGWYSWGTFLLIISLPGLQLKRLSRPKGSGVPHCHLLLAQRSMVGIEVHPPFCALPSLGSFLSPKSLLAKSGVCPHRRAPLEFWGTYFV